MGAEVTNYIGVQGRKEIMREFEGDPLYYRVLIANNEDVFRDALDTLSNIRGPKAVENLLEAVKNKVKKP